VQVERDLVGYGPTPPNPQWPGGARVAVNFVLNYEEGSEYAVIDGDDRCELGLAETQGGRVVAGQRDMAFESMYEYGSRVGVWRVLRLFRERGLPLTAFACAVALERNPRVAQALVSDGHDLCCHGWRWEEHFRLEPDKERERIERAVQSMKKTIGAAPDGWYCRYGPSPNTRRLLVEHGGFLYDSDAYNDELPYWSSVAGRSHLVIPYTMDANDAKFTTAGGFSTGQSFTTYLRETFDQLYDEGAEQPRMMSVGLHPRLVGRPGRAHGLAAFLDYLQGKEGVWICRRADIARHWIRIHPPPSPKL